jgi:hypothetical protein
MTSYGRISQRETLLFLKRTFEGKCNGDLCFRGRLEDV